MGWPLQADGALTLTADTAGAAWVSGFLRRPTDGALVATLVVGGSKQRGFLRSTAGALVYNVGGAVSYQQHGFAFAADDSLCTVAVDPNVQYAAPGGGGGTDDLRQHGLKRDTSGRVYATVVA